jgi:hypothetical protein
MLEYAELCYAGLRASIGEHGGDPMMAHIAMMRALHRRRAEGSTGTAPETNQGIPDHSMTRAPCRITAKIVTATLARLRYPERARAVNRS